VKITKNQLRRIIREEKQKLLEENRVRKAVRKAILNEGVHPYDKGLMQAMDVGYYSDSDALSEIEGDLMNVDTAGLSPAALEELEELKDSIKGGYNDDAYDLLRYIPKEIKDRLPVQEFDDDDDY
jgi:hypothetical protein